MKLTIDVKSRAEAAAIQRGMTDPAVRAFVVTVGVLADLPSDRARARVMTFIADHFADGARVDELHAHRDTNGSDHETDAPRLR